MWFNRFISLLLACQMLNLSVDMPEPGRYQVAEDLSVNEMESIVEIVLEQCLDLENAIAESDETGQEANDTDNTKSLQLFYPGLLVHSLPENGGRFCKWLQNTELFLSHCSEIQAPPPRS